MKISITAPSLNTNKNVSGVATVVKNIIHYNTHHQYFHYLLGRPDRKQNKLLWSMELIRQIFLFPFAVKFNKVDLVHQNLPLNLKGVVREYIISLWCRILKVPVVLHVHGGELLMKRTNNTVLLMLIKSIFKQSKQVIVLSDLEKDALRANYQCFSAKVLFNSVDVTKYAYDLNIKKEKGTTILFFGRIHESKGIEDIIEAFKYLKNKIDFRFILCGNGPLKDNFITECKEILGDDFEYRGVVSGAEKLRVINDADYFLLPSRYGEGLPMALLETMAAGVVPVVTDDASMKFVVENDINGIRVQKRDPKDLSDKLERIILNPDLYKILSTNAQKTIKEKYDIGNYIAELNKIYETVTINKK